MKNVSSRAFLQGREEIWLCQKRTQLEQSSFMMMTMDDADLYSS